MRLALTVRNIREERERCARSKRRYLNQAQNGDDKKQEAKKYFYSELGKKGCLKARRMEREGKKMTVTVLAIHAGEKAMNNLIPSNGGEKSGGTNNHEARF